MRLLSLLPLAACAHDPAHIPARALHTMLLEDPARYAVVDVRSHGEFHGSLGHIPDTQHVAWPAVKETAPQIQVTPGQEIVLICFTGHRSRWSMPYVQEAWPDNPVRDLRGGMIAWWARGLPVAREPHAPPPSTDGKLPEHAGR